MGAVAVQHLGGDRFVAAVRGHEIAFDQPEGTGGDDTAPTPTEVFVASLAACVAFFARRYLHRHGLEEADLQVSARYELSEDRPHRVGDLEITVSTGVDLPDAKLAAFRRVVEGCTLHQTLELPPRVQMRLEVGMAAAQSRSASEAAGRGPR